MSKYSIGIDLGGTNLRVALVSEEGQITKRVKRPSSNNIIDLLIGSVSEIISNEVVGIGIGVAGLVNREKGIVLRSPNLPYIEGLNISDILKNRFNVPVIIENDANTAALGEKWFGAGKEFRNFVLLTLGTGIGGGVIYEGRLMDIPSEIGHTVVVASGIKCSCGNNGCLEAYAGGKAILTRVINALESGAESPLRTLHDGNFYKLTVEDVYKMALEGDILSRESLKEAGRYLGIGISNVINIFRPEAIILTGGLTGAWNIYVQEAIKEALKRCFKEFTDNVKIIPSILMDDAGLLGAACLTFTCRQRYETSQ